MECDLERFEPSSEIVGVDKVAETRTQLVVVDVVEALCRRFLDGPIHSLDLNIRSRMVWHGAVLGVVLSANLVDVVNPTAWAAASTRLVISTQSIEGSPLNSLARRQGG